MRRIILLGATGYTGSRVLNELAISGGADVVLVGRSRERLQAQADASGIDCQIVEADTAARGALDSLLSGDDVVVSTVGPFGELGREVARSVARIGGVYFDSTGEPPFIEWMFRELDERARETGALLVPAFGYDYVPGNIAGWLAAQDGGPEVAAVEVGYFLMQGSRGGYRPVRLRHLPDVTTPGTRESAFKVLAEPAFAFRASAGDRFGLEPQRSGSRMLRFGVDGHALNALSIGGSEHFGLPEVLPDICSVDVGLGWFGPAVAPVHYATRAAGPLVTSDLSRRVTAAAAERMPFKKRFPRAQARTVVVGRTRDTADRVLSEIVMDGPEPYAMTAGLLSRAARIVAAGDGEPTGVRGPLAALGAEELVRVGEKIGFTRV
ncbi:saccharopine dehydrogenase NADP-binding domain-containing protein [Gordonia liuliyuniae]|uniref:Saccharopine dehydrogenase NADP-binding domain-containing protein n=1 Tax=Gordonia liuliyuniae TaxID=2911517 RepID=A0ABS9IXT8_9ACTN|nr:saccharopine dehydrogenase NADP-binding domain-containing protein [Gordonia liuliyuniae]MCF8590388.1 saccharopine dehydrogenase NADP-binding domain-containing protein [Gordonia liuliyuniae]